MQPDAEPQSPKDSRQAGSVPPLVLASRPPVICAPPPLAGSPLPPLAPEPARRPPPLRRVLAFLLSLCLGLFLADAVVSLVDDSLILLLHIRVLAAVRGWMFFFATLVALAKVMVVLLAVVVYLAVCASLAVGHLSEGFLALRPGGITVQVREIARSDGKTIQFAPMTHIAEADFYHRLSPSFPSDAVVLMEGVTDNSNLLTNRITYKRAAASLGLAEQHEEFHPVQSQLVMADVDVERFTPNTIGFLNLTMLVHSKGLTAETVLKLIQYSPPPPFRGAAL